jgi:hypothetical protein
MTTARDIGTGSNGLTAQLHKSTTDLYRAMVPYRPPASPDDALARQAVAEIEREEGFDRCAECRLHGAYDGDAEHRIALAAIRLARQSTTEGREADNSLPSNR